MSASTSDWNLKGTLRIILSALAATFGTFLIVGGAHAANAWHCDSLPGVTDEAYLTTDIAEAVRLLKLTYREDQCVRAAIEKACPSSGTPPNRTCRAAQHRVSLTDYSNLLRLSVILERHTPESILKRDHAAFRAIVLIMHYRIAGLAFEDKNSMYRDRREEILPLVEQAAREGAIDIQLRDRFVARLLESRGASPAATSLAAPACDLTNADLAANAKLSFDDFDQRGVTPSTFRKLLERGCFREAARAAEHYLLFGPKLPAENRDVVSWHLGQALGYAGDEATAAKVMASTRKPAETQPDELDWDTYVVGTWAFLTKDRALLEESVKKLSAAPGAGNANNASVLRRLNDCFDKSYLEAQKICRN